MGTGERDKGEEWSGPPRAFPLVFLMAPLERTVLGFLVISPFFLYTRQAILTPNFHSEGPVMPSLVSPYHTNYGRVSRYGYSNRLGVLDQHPCAPPPLRPLPLAAYCGRLCVRTELFPSTHAPECSAPRSILQPLLGCCVSDGIRLQHMGIGLDLTRRTTSAERIHLRLCGQGSGRDSGVALV